MACRPSTTLEDLLGTVLLKVAYDWEALPLPGFPLQDFSTDGGVVTYTVPFTVEGIGPRVGGQVGVHMPAGARYVPGSTLLSGGAGIATGEPTLSSPQNQLTWTDHRHPARHALHAHLPREARPQPGHRVRPARRSSPPASTGPFSARARRPP